MANPRGLLLDLITAVALGLIIAALAAARQFERLELDSVMSTPLLDRSFLGTTGDDGVDDRDEFAARVALVALRGSFTVASSQKLIHTIGEDIRDHEIVILDFTETVYIDDSAALVVEHLTEAAVEQGTSTVVVGLRGTPAVSLNGLGVLRHVPRSHFVETLDEARDVAARMLLGEE